MPRYCQGVPAILFKCQGEKLSNFSSVEPTEYDPMNCLNKNHQ